MPEAASLPPRSALSRDVEVPVLPGLGRTWYGPGGRYWARRAGLTLMWAVALLAIVLIDVGIFTAIRHSSQAAFAILLTIDMVVAVAVLGYFAVRMVRRWNTPGWPGSSVSTATGPGRIACPDE